MWLQVLYHVSYRLINSFHDYLRALPHRVYICATHGSSGCYRDLTDPLVDQYIQLQRDYLLLRRTADFDNDKAPPRCLWPRVELVPQVQIAKAKRFHCRFTFAVVGDPEDYRAVVFQLAETEYSNSPPILQLQVRNRQLRLRHNQFTRKGRVRGFRNVDIAPMGPMDGRRKYRIDLYGELNVRNGLLILHLDGREVWRRRGITTLPTLHPAGIRYGCFGRAGTDLELHVYEVFIAHHDLLPE